MIRGGLYFWAYENIIKEKFEFSNTIGRLILISIHGLRFRILDTGFILVTSIGISPPLIIICK